MFKTKTRSQIKHIVVSCLLLGVTGLPLLSQAQSTWTGGTSSDWNTAGNWSAGVPSGVNAVINTSAPNICKISANILATPVDIFVGSASGANTARVDHVSGDAFTGNGNWMFVGQDGASGTYNLADTTTTGGAFTGFGQGSGNLLAGGNGTGGNLFVGRFGGSVGTFNMNSSGTLTVREWLVIGGNAATGTLNLDNGTIAVGNDVEVGGNSTSGSGTMRVSGGSVDARIVTVGRGNNNASTVTGLLYLSGGTVSSRQWFTLGFAGNASDIGTVTNNGGTINVNTAGGGTLEMTVWDTARAQFTLDSGSVNLHNNASALFGSLGNSGVATFDQNGGTVTFYSDGGTTVGGTGALVLGNAGAQPWEISSGTYTYNFNGGTLTVPQITKISANGSGTFNFNGGTLKPTASTTTFVEGLSAANILSGGANIDTDGFDITVAQSLSGTGVLNKLGLGTLTLAGNSTHTGNIVINNGTLALSGTATLNSHIVIPSSRTLDVSGLTVGIQNPVSGVGSVNGSATSAAGMAIYPATDGTVGTLTFNNNLDLNAGGSIRLDLSTSHLGGNDQVVVSGNLSVSSSTVIRIRALNGAANLSTAADYVLCSVAGTTTMGTTPALAWDGTAPANYLNFSVQTNGNNLVLHYTPATAPMVTASSTPATVSRNQGIAVSATVTPGSGSVTNVQIDASPIGSSATATLILSGTPNVYTNTFVVASATVPGVKVMTVVAQANTGLNSPGYSVTNTVVATNKVWTGAGVNDNWTTNSNWNIAAPASSGDAVTFAGTTRLTPNLDANYSVTSVTFDPTAGNFQIGTANSSTLTLTANGVVNNSANAQTLNVPIVLDGAQTFNAAAGDLVINNHLDKAGNLVTVTGAANTVISGTVSSSGSLFKKGSGSLTVPTSASWDLNQASAGGFSGPLIAQAGTVTFNNSSVQTVTGELVIGGVIANGGAGNNARVIVDNATLNVSSWLSIGRGNGVGGVSSDLVLTNGAIVTAQDVSAGFNGGNAANMPKGSVTLHDNSSLTINGQFHVAEAGGANMNVTVNGSATLSVGGLLDLAIGFGDNTVANLTVNGGTVSCGGDPFIGHWGDGKATLVVNSGAFNVGTVGERWLYMGYWDWVEGQIDINGGALNFWNNSKLRMARNDNNAGNAFAHVINHNGGDVTCYSDGGTTVGGSGLLDLQFTGAASGTSTYNLNGGVLTVPTIMSSATTGTRIFNFNGGTLKAAAGGTLMDLGTGNAHAYVRTNGAIIDDGGQVVTISTALEHFSGDANDGGLTKQGSGTLNLTGANSYKGKTVVSAGTLELAQATLAPPSSVSISNAAVLQLDFATTNQVSALVLNGVNQPAGVYSIGNVPTYITGTGSLLVQPVATNPTNITFSASGGTMTLSWPTSHLGWTLYTNSVGVAATSQWFPLPGSSSVTNVNLTLNPSQPNVFFRLQL